jgi:hypothetical protein
MTPDDVRTVQRSWAELQACRAALVASLTCLLAGSAPSEVTASVKATWLVGAVDDLVGLLPAPSRLATAARALGRSWPGSLTAPSFAVEGRAWMAAARSCLPTWSASTEAAWRQAWFLLSDVLAAEILSPFTDGPEPDPGRGKAGGRPVSYLPDTAHHIEPRTD